MCVCVCARVIPPPVFRNTQLFYPKLYGFVFISGDVKKDQFPIKVIFVSHVIIRIILCISFLSFFLFLFFLFLLKPNTFAFFFLFLLKPSIFASFFLFLLKPSTFASFF